MKIDLPQATTRMTNHKVLTLVLYGLILGYAALFSPLKALVGLAPFVLTLAFATYLTVTVGRRYFQPTLVAFAAVGAVYAALSAAGLLHGGLTIMFEPSAIPQQAAYLFALPVLIPAFAYFCERLHHNDRHYRALETLLIPICILSNGLQVLSSGSLMSFGIGQLTNPDAILAFILVRRLTYTRRLGPLGKVVATGLLFVVSRSGQAVLSMLFLLFARLYPHGARAMLATFLVLFVASAITSLAFADLLWTFDPNTGIRAVFWNDAIARIIESRGIGVGFGTETIRPIFSLQAADVVISSMDAEGFIYVGAHNAFVDAAYRMGLIGLVLLLFYFGRDLAAVMRSRKATKSLNFDCWVAATLIVSLGVNVGLASANFLYGNALLLGWLAYRRTSEGALRRGRRNSRLLRFGVKQDLPRIHVHGQSSESNIASRSRVT